MRAIRRFHTQRLKTKRKFHWGYELIGSSLEKVIKTPTPCSCWMCGNPRKYFGTKTYQELKQEEFEKVEPFD